MKKILYLLVLVALAAGSAQAEVYTWTGGATTGGADIGYVPTSGTAAEGGANWFEIFHAHRKGAEAELDYIQECSSSLISNDGASAIHAIDNALEGFYKIYC